MELLGGGRARLCFGICEGVKDACHSPILEGDRAFLGSEACALFGFGVAGKVSNPKGFRFVVPKGSVKCQEIS